MTRANQPVDMLARCLVAAALLGSGCLVACGAGSDDGSEQEERFLTPREGGARKSTPAAEAGAPEEPAEPTGAPDAGGTCDYPTTCENARDYGEIHADEGTETKIFEGSRSAWIGLRAIEGSLGAARMKITAELKMPAGSNYDLFVYMDSAKDELTCANVAAQGKTAGDAIETVNVNWGEQAVLGNGSSDSRPIRIEVRHVSGACAPGVKWKLTVSGNK
jgi:hypothetical protein